jgi:hypothetical protein
VLPALLLVGGAFAALLATSAPSRRKPGTPDDTLHAAGLARDYVRVHPSYEPRLVSLAKLAREKGREDVARTLEE